MARKGAMKRALSKGKFGGGVAKKCKTIKSTLRSAEDVPQPVRSMLCDMLGRTFGTYKEERHAFQKSASTLVGNILQSTQGKLQTAIKEAQVQKAGLDREAATLSATNDAAVAASDAAAKALADGKAAVTDSKTALKDAKSAVHDLETETKAEDAKASAAATKKEKIEALATDFLGPIREGTQHGAAAGRHVTSVLASSLETEFLACVTRTFSKASASWGTFDAIVSKRLDTEVQKILAGLSADLAAMASAKETRASNLEASKVAITTAEEKAKAMEDACGTAGTMAKEAEATAKAATAALKHGQQQVHKAEHTCTHAEEALTTFTNGPLAAYTELEARTAPPPPPEPQAEAAPVAAAAMAPAPETRPTPTIAPSPSILGMVSQGVRSLLPSPRLATSPAVAPSPRVASSPSGSARVAASPRRVTPSPRVASSPRGAS